MKKTLLFSACVALTASLVSCGGPGGKAKTAGDASAKAESETPAVPEYTVVDNAQVDLASFPQDKDGYYVIFDGKTLNGWRGYGKENVPSRWTIDDGAIKFNGSGGGEAQTGEGGDLIFAKKFKNFELEMEWKVSKGGNSGIFYLAQEVTTQRTARPNTNRSTSRAPSTRCSTMRTTPTPNWALTATASRHRSTT